MLFSDLIQETYFALSANKSRSALTILGIVIGIGSVIAMISIGQGAAKDIQSNIQSLGSNLLVVMPGSQQGPGSMVRGGMGSAETLTLADAEAIKENIKNIQAVAPEVNSREQVTTKGENTNTGIYGIDENYFKVKNIELNSGQSISEQHINKLSRVAILGPNTVEDLFSTGADPLGQTVRIGGQQYTILGITKSKGGTGFGSSDDLIYIPISTAQQYLTGSDSVANINVQVTKENLMTAVQEQINTLLLVRHKIKDPLQADFSIMNQADIIDTMSSVAGTLTLLLGSIAGISLVVGGIGIMNMMLTTVTERTKEIGLRKSLGAKKTDISTQFLGESVSLTFIGGMIGIFIGWGASLLITKFSDMTTVVTPFAVLLAFGVSAAIGIVFGYYPAHRAAKLDPIEALRYE